MANKKQWNANLASKHQQDTFAARMTLGKRRDVKCCAVDRDPRASSPTVCRKRRCVDNLLRLGHSFRHRGGGSQCDGRDRTESRNACLYL